MNIAFLTSAAITIWLSFATYSNGLALLALITTITLGIVAIRKGH